MREKEYEYSAQDGVPYVKGLDRENPHLTDCPKENVEIRKLRNKMTEFLNKYKIELNYTNKNK